MLWGCCCGVRKRGVLLQMERVLLARQHGGSKQEHQQSNAVGDYGVDIVGSKGRGILATVDDVHVWVPPGSRSVDLGCWW
jgi:hypothetical protein